MAAYDLIIIGAGPAGITASVYAARKKLSFLTISKDIGGQAAWSGDVENYTGYQFVTGPELTQKFEEHLRQYKIGLKEGEEVTEVRRTGRTIVVRTAKGAYEAMAVVVASGKISRELGVPGEKEFKNRGLTYCATCDGPLFAGKEVAVIGGGNSALDAALQLVRIAKKVYVINNLPALGGDAVVREKVEKSPVVSVLNGTVVTRIAGEKMVSGMTVRGPEGERSYPVEGIFVEIGLIPNSAFVQDVEKNREGEIVVNCRNETSVAGIFAAGDVTTVPEKQIIIAAGEGAKATLAAFRYLNQQA